MITEFKAGKTYVFMNRGFTSKRSFDEWCTKNMIFTAPVQKCMNAQKVPTPFMDYNSNYTYSIRFRDIPDEWFWDIRDFEEYVKPVKYKDEEYV